MQTDSNWPYSLFQAFGLELEYMIVRADSLDVLPIADHVLREAAGELTGEVERGRISWSNELALHVLEFKTSSPVPRLDGVSRDFQEDIIEANRILRRFDARLLPSGMHPWMNPALEFRVWPHEYNAVYEAYNRIFNCSGHGWANLQSAHLNLPFRTAEEFGRLHAAIRLTLPLLPALAASSPFVERAATGVMDNRLLVYAGNARRVPSITGKVIPEPCFSPESYRREILDKMYSDIAPHEPEGLLRHEWLNSRGAIARFQRGTIEIRVLDVQECPAADVAITKLIAAVLEALASESWMSYELQQRASTDSLVKIYKQCVHSADEAEVDDPEYLKHFGVSEETIKAGELWRRLADWTRSRASEATCEDFDSEEAALQVILTDGPLARRIQRAVGSDMDNLHHVYGELADCLAVGRSFRSSQITQP